MTLKLYRFVNQSQIMCARRHEVGKIVTYRIIRKVNNISSHSPRQQYSTEVRRRPAAP